MGILGKIFGSNEREIRKLEPLVEKINSLEEEVKKLSLSDFKNKTGEFKDRIAKGEKPEDILPEAFALVREAASRAIGERHFDVQLIGGMVLHQGKIAEMKTGEGKTLAATLSVYLNALSGKGVHIVTVNDYLAKRDCNWMGAVYHSLGLSTACIVHDTAFLYEPKKVDADEVSIEEENLKPVSRKEAYLADITYGTNNEFGFDYLRDNMALSLEQVSQRELNYAIVDEVDSILIDEARTPLIISAPDEESGKLYSKFAQMVPRLKENEDYTVDEKEKAVSIKESGISKIENWLGVGNIYEQGKIKFVHHLEQALKAQAIFKRDRDYVVKEGQVIIVDDFTGRLMEGRRYSEGLHQAIEAKEGVTVQKESRTLATITFQNYFRMYKKLAGMTGTAITSAEEFAKVYKLDVMEIPTNMPMVRNDLADIVYKTEEAKFTAIADKIKELNKKGQPILIGTIAVEKSEYLSSLLDREGIGHSVLNAKNHEKEALIITRAGEKSSVTVATNMAGRGTDIKLSEGVKELGGLFVLGTERHEARRIDNQLRGRSGRQGDSGASQFYVSLEDELMRRFGGDKLKNMMNRLGLPDDQPIQNRIISKSIESAQSKIEGYNFDIRKHVLDYDDVMNKQREVIYKKRLAVLEKANVKNEILDDIKEEIEMIASMHAVGDPHDWNMESIFSEANAIIELPEDTKKCVEEIRNNKSDDEKDKIGKIIDCIFGAAKEKYNRKEQEIGEERMRQIEKILTLQITDMFWMNHLDEMDYLRSGIGLRGYGQRDPLIEYKKESFNLFSSLMGAIRRQVVSSIFKVQPAIRQEPAEEKKELKYAGAEEVKQFGALEKKEQAGNSSGAEEQKQKPIIKKDHVGRNDPCPCGSGKKYKKCCGA